MYLTKCGDDLNPPRDPQMVYVSEDGGATWISLADLAKAQVAKKSYYEALPHTLCRIRIPVNDIFSWKGNWSCSINFATYDLVLVFSMHVHCFCREETTTQSKS